MITTVKIDHYIFEGQAIIKGNGTLTKSMIADTLKADTLTFKVYSPEAFTRLYGSEPAAFWWKIDNPSPFPDTYIPLYVKNGDDGLQDIPRGTKALIERADATTLAMYVDYIELNDIGIYTLHLTSAVGMLASMRHYGGMYVAETWGDVCAEIMDATLISQDAENKTYRSSFGWDYYVPLEIDALVVNGRLGVNNRRENLRQLMFPYGVSLMVSGDYEGSLLFTYNEPDTATVIPDTDVGVGGKAKTPSVVTNVTVTEHSYHETAAETETLYEDLSRDVTDLIIIFEDAFYDLTAIPASGFSFDIVESNCNYAKVTGRGTLTGKRYTHYTATYSQSTGKDGTTNDVNFNDMTLVSSLNSTNTINRLVNYFANATFINRKFLINKLKCGDIVNITAPVTKEKVNAYIQSLSPNYSSTLYGMANLVTNWTPKYLGNNFDAFMILTDADIVGGVWTPPPELQGQTVKMVAFSGAQGGQGGYAGQSVGEASGTGDQWHGGWWYDDDIYIGGASANVVQGGNGGQGGAGGKAAAKIIEAILTLGASHNVSLGAGGTGGAGGTLSTAPAEGAQGEHTTFDSYDTDNGVDFAGTYVNLLTGETIAETGDTGIAGGKGGAGGKSGGSLEAGQAQTGEAVGENTGGAGGAGNSSTNRFTSVIGGGGGGGAAAGANGNAGGTGGVLSMQSISNQYGEHFRLYYAGLKSAGGVYSGVPTGGNGANAVTVPSQPLYKGGTGGAGGGGAGGCGQPMGFITLQSGAVLGVAKGGNGGNGGQGGQGSNGFIIIYYKE